MADLFAIQITDGAEADLRALPVRARRLVLDGLETHLLHQPTVGSRKVKPLRPNPVAGWELRLGDYRVLFDVDSTVHLVTIQVVGEKVGNRLIVQNKEYTDHESR